MSLELPPALLCHLWVLQCLSVLVWCQVASNCLDTCANEVLSMTWHVLYMFDIAYESAMLACQQINQQLLRVPQGQS